MACVQWPPNALIDAVVEAVGSAIDDALISPAVNQDQAARAFASGRDR